MNSKNKIYIATDGACSGNGKDVSPGGYGAVLLYGEHKKEISGGLPKTTNNEMELTAVVEALSAIKKDLPVVVYCDSAYVVNCINEGWYKKWYVNGWRSSKKEPVANKKIWQQLLFQYERLTNAEFIKVKGHLDLSDDAAIKKWLNKLNQVSQKSGGRKISESEYLMALELNARADELAVLAMAQYKDL